MTFNVIGESSAPQILCIHLLFGNSDSVTEILNCIKGNYMFIVSDISSHGADNEEFVSAEKEAVISEQGRMQIKSQLHILNR